ncbi:gibberellin-regulated protein 12-like [Cicer arietinum]|uniref:Gibberellin-regulated protein 12-like n=1 Tax=Cicer arietinum TaxID=3827 RepID=A0A1S2Z8N5_CICAR|nr:gibberellin-regulated protein 12-like [Cicer arietinum]
MTKFVCAILLMLVMAFAIKDTYAGKEGSLRPKECATACALRCSATQYKEACLTYCNLCCAKCLCVPSGTYGHKEECPCYNNWKTKKGGPKCP